MAELAPVRLIHAVSILKGDEYPISKEELDLLLSIPSGTWIEAAGLDATTLDDLARKGLVVMDDDDPELSALRGRDEQLQSCGWNVYAALYHFLTRWSGVDLRTTPEEEFPPITRGMIEEFVALRGRPPGAFHSVEQPQAVHELPIVRRDGGLYAALAARKTTRGFDRGAALTIEELAVPLYYVWGCHGTAPIVGELVCLKRTSPSGGGLHPVEVYPLISRVEGVEPGLYHYNGRDHSLELIQRIEEEAAVTLATQLLCGQAYFGSAHVSFVMTARFPRNHWKYERHDKAYSAILMDAAHLSQTLYLVAAEHGLGAFFTLSINSVEIEERLGLDGISEGVVAMAGLGRRPPGPSPFEPRFLPYVPRETSV